MWKDTLLTAAKTLHEEMIGHRRWLHAHAEVGFDLSETKAYVKQMLAQMGLSPEDCGRAGIVVSIRGQHPGNVFLLRADMDALPIPEASGEPFSSSKNMHACGHDMHTAILLGAAKLLKEQTENIHGTIKLMFQPAEEIFEGASDMIQSGVLESPHVDAAMMLHVSAAVPMPAGTILVSAPGVSAPAADYFKIHVQGVGCHGSAPQNGVDAITAASHIVIALQEIHARELSASEEAVLTIGKISGGDAANAIADSVLLEGTLRTYDEGIRQKIKLRLSEIASGIASAFRAKAEISFGSSCPTLLNDKELSQNTLCYLTELFGKNNVFSTAALSPDGKPVRGGGSEDFAYISQKVPSLMFALTAGTPENGYVYPQHHPKVRFDESVLPIGTAALTYVAMRWLEEHH